MLTQIKDILKNSSLRRADMAGPVSIARTIECAEECLKQVIPEVGGVRIQSLRDGVLTITTESTLMAHEVHLHAARFIAAVNGKMGDGVIVRVRYQIAKKDEL